MQPDGLLTIFEPDWSSLVVNGSPVPTDWVSAARHPAVGSALGDLLAAAGCSILDRVEERSWWTYEDLVCITNLEPSLDRAVASGVASRLEVTRWLVEQRRRAQANDFKAEIAKILWVANTPG